MRKLLLMAIVLGSSFSALAVEPTLPNAEGLAKAGPDEMKEYCYAVGIVLGQALAGLQTERTSFNGTSLAREKIEKHFQNVAESKQKFDAICLAKNH